MPRGKHDVDMQEDPFGIIDIAEGWGGSKEERVRVARSLDRGQEITM